MIVRLRLEGYWKKLPCGVEVHVSKLSDADSSDTSPKSFGV
jgi:hypothetical protein